MLLDIKNLQVKIGEKKVINGLSLSMQPGEIHIIMGPNGSGKSTLVNAIMGNPQFNVISGQINFLGKNIKKLSPAERAVTGLFLAFQYPREIMGVQLNRFLFLAYQNVMRARRQKNTLDVFAFNEKLAVLAKKLNLRSEFLERSLNVGFSGGEKKKAEMLQLAILEPKLALLDETDSGLDIDALRVVGRSAKNFINSKRGLLIVTHYPRLLKYLRPDFVHVMIGGQIVKSGGRKLAADLEKNGYKKFAGQTSSYEKK